MGGGVALEGCEGGGFGGGFDDELVVGEVDGGAGVDGDVGLVAGGGVAGASLSLALLPTSRVPLPVIWEAVVLALTRRAALLVTAVAVGRAAVEAMRSVPALMVVPPE